MKKLTIAVFTVLFFSGAAFAAREFIEGTDFFVDFTQKEYGMASVLRINFSDVEPTPQEAEFLLKDQLTIYGKILEDERIAQEKEETGETKKSSKAKTVQTPAAAEVIAEEEEVRFKNIVGSVWHFAKGSRETAVKIKFNDHLASYVYIGKTKKIAPFPDYLAFLKKERDDKKVKEKLKAAAEKQTALRTDFQE
jgi:hypothetical protein